ncbi:putative metal-binding protein [Micromonospora sp. NPDC048930]|uniref:putative metal-binding protein n=1 Tax=Micromonospora sp. NPDC048930 TaxID=3364261 RepID=UPI0037236AB3
MVTAVAAQAAGPLLVPPEVSRRKLERELDDWKTCEELYLRRGWRLRQVSDLCIELLFLAAVPVDPTARITVVAPCVEVRFDNYDLMAPSVRFLDPLTLQPQHPGIAAVLTSDGQDRNVLIDQHPDTGLPFLCVPGVREYHNHPQHGGDDWLLHRGRGEGRLAVICDRIWRTMARTLIGIDVHTRWTPPVSELQVRLMQGKPEQLQALAAQMDNAASGEGQPGLAEHGLRLAAQLVPESPPRAVGPPVPGRAK